MLENIKLSRKYLKHEITLFRMVAKDQVGSKAIEYE